MADQDEQATGSVEGDFHGHGDYRVLMGDLEVDVVSALTIPTYGDHADTSERCEIDRD